MHEWSRKMSSSEQTEGIDELIAETTDILTRLRRLGLGIRERHLLSRITKRLKERALTPRDIARLRRLLRQHHVVISEPFYENLKRISSLSEAEDLYVLLRKEMTKRIKDSKEKKKKLNVVFMFGSGASNPPPSNIPTVTEMLNYLVEKLPPTEIPFASKVKEWATQNSINIEDILTAGYLGTFLVSKPVVNRIIGEIIYRERAEEVGELREREYVFSFQDLVNRVFSMVSGMMAKADSNIVHETIAKLMKDFENDEVLEFSITTTNYDVCIEKAFVKHKLKYRYLGIEEGKGLPIVKIHGSINWFYCEGCQSVITYSMKELEAFKKIFPTSGSCQKCGTPTSLFMVPPIAYKYVMFPPLIDIWQAGMSTLEKADVIIAIGYSFSLADDYIFKMIVSGMKKKSSTLIMLDRNFDSIANLKTKLLAYHIKLPYPINGDAAKTVPQIAKIITEARNKGGEGKAATKKTKK